MVRLLMIVCLFFPAPASAAADEEPSAPTHEPVDFDEDEFEAGDSFRFRDQRWRMSLGYYQATLDTEFRVDGASRGTQVHMQRDLGVEPTDRTLMLLGIYRFDTRHSLHFGAHDYSRRGVVELTAHLQVGDDAYPVGTDAHSEFDTTIVFAAYRYNFINNEDQGLSVSLGLHVSDNDFRISSADGRIESDLDIDAPLPMLGVQWRYSLGAHWGVGLDFEYMDVELGDLRGRFQNYFITTAYRFSENWALGLAFHSFEMNVREDRPLLDVALDYRFKGPMVFVTAGF